MPAHYSVVQYVPDPIAGERINIGVITVERNHVASRFLANWDRALEFGGLEVDFLQEFANSVAATTAESHNPGLWPVHPLADLDTLRKMATGWIGSIQLTEPSPSVLDYRALLDDIVSDYLKEETEEVDLIQPTKREYRDKRPIVRETRDQLQTALYRRFHTDAVNRLVARNVKFRGEKDEHRFDVAIKNGTVYAGAFAMSFELPNPETLEQQAESLYWHVTDMRTGKPEVPLIVVTLPPQQGVMRYPRSQALYKDVVRICKSLDTPVVPADELASAADELAARVPLQAIPRAWDSDVSQGSIL